MESWDFEQKAGAMGTPWFSSSALPGMKTLMMAFNFIFWVSKWNSSSVRFKNWCTLSWWFFCSYQLLNACATCFIQFHYFFILSCTVFFIPNTRVAPKVLPPNFFFYTETATYTKITIILLDRAMSRLEKAIFQHSRHHSLRIFFFFCRAEQEPVYRACKHLHQGRWPIASQMCWRRRC